MASISSVKTVESSALLVLILVHQGLLNTCLSLILLVTICDLQIEVEKMLCVHVKLQFFQWHSVSELCTGDFFILLCGHRALEDLILELLHCVCELITHLFMCQCCHAAKVKETKMTLYNFRNHCLKISPFVQTAWEFPSGNDLK